MSCSVPDAALLLISYTGGVFHWGSSVEGPRWQSLDSQRAAGVITGVEFCCFGGETHSLVC